LTGLFCLAASLWIGTGCTSKNDPPKVASPGDPAAATDLTRTNGAGAIKPGAFEDVTAKAGIKFDYTNGLDGNYRMVETTPGGCAFFDYNQDGWQDVFLVQSGASPGSKESGARPPCALYRNKGDGTFEDVTQAAGIDKIDQGYAQCVTVGDYDNDGFPDVYITAYGGNHLLRNTGKGQFVDVTAQAGVGDKDKGIVWCTGAAWGDYDHDGYLDLVVLRYAPWSPEKDTKCENTKKHRTYCSPEVYTEGRPRLFRNLGNGKFADVTALMGLDTSKETGDADKIKGRLLGALWIDYDQDGWTDLYMTGDITPNLLLHNIKGKKFEEVGLREGVSHGTDATILSGMGVTAGDYTNNGWQTIVVTNFSGQPNSVYKGVPSGKFEDTTYTSGIGEPSLNFLAWGVEFVDYDNDGFLDLVVGNGHVDPFIEEVAQNVTYKERKLLFHNLGNGTFKDNVDDLGALAEERVTRGLAIGDFDNDGRVDVLDNAHNMPARLYRNVKQGGGFFTLRLEGVKSNRDAAGALVWLTAGGRRRVIEIRNASSYASTSDRRAHWGLGKATQVEKLEVRWPSGLRQTFTNLPGNQFYYLKEGQSPIPDPQIKRKS
jgi:hypothetical protein